MPLKPFEDSDWSKDDLPLVQPLTRDEAQALIARRPLMSVWRVIAAQLVFGVLVALAWGVLSRSSSSAVSALYGVAVAVIPGALMAWGVFGASVRLKAGRSVGGLFFWELLKLGLTGAMLALANAWIKPLDWVAMLVTLVLCLKVVGVVLLIWQGHNKNSV
ncbi:MAG: ATP synthase subunit I [Hydrogenophaga sp.]|nr:ATP synthase subunit I [Hydrogenophaga sp.]